MPGRQSQRTTLPVSFFVRHHIAVNVHLGVDVRVVHQLLLRVEKTPELWIQQKPRFSLRLEYSKSPDYDGDESGRHLCVAGDGPPSS